MPEFVREAGVAALREDRRPWDLVIIGGGATGVGCALDAAARGYRVALVEQADFGQGTSSRSTKLIHGGVRYLRQGNVPLVTQALRERAFLLKNAPHLVSPLEFVVPAYGRWKRRWYGLGLRLYDALAGARGMGRSRCVDTAQVRELLPNVRAQDLVGGVTYVDGRFDDARLVIDLAITASEHGAVLVNRVRVTALAMAGPGGPHRVTVRDEEAGESFSVSARAVVNATGPFADVLRRLADSAAVPFMAPSQGVHLVLPGEFLGGRSALLIPETEDGRVLFLIPWHGRALLGTTDTPVKEVVLEPHATSSEVDFLLRTASRHLARAPRREDVLSLFTGIRPLVRMRRRGRTSSLSREHVVEISPAGLLTIAGGKWTTYRQMAEDTVDAAARLAGLPQRPCPTRDLRIHGHDAAARDAALDSVHPRLPLRAGDVLRMAHKEMARTVDDVLCRRTPSLYLDARAAREAAPAVADLLAVALSRDARWRDDQVRSFDVLAAHSLP